MQCVAVRCSALQSVAVCCSVLQCVVPRERVCIYICICMSLQYAAVCCSVLQCVAVRCGVWQCGLYSVCVSYGVASAWKSMYAYMRTGQWRPIGYFIFTGQFLHKSPVIGSFLAEKNLQVRGGPEPLENEINKVLGSKREDRFSDHFSGLVQNICSVRFSYLLRLSIFCNLKAPRDMQKFPQKCQKIAGR